MTTPLVITHLRGGLGNQMFQYAAGRALALRIGAEPRLDLSCYALEDEKGSPRPYMLNVFPNIRMATATRQECERLIYTRRGLLDVLLRRPRHHAASYVAEPHFDYWDGFERLAVPAYLFGYWQNELYFNTVADTIRRDFSFPPLASGAAEETAVRIRAACNAVAVHVRRGDYATNPVAHGFHGLCPPEYYYKAFGAVATHVEAEPETFVFSDDPAWVRKHFDTRGFPTTIIDFPEHADKPWHDMHLMSLCKHHIIANSSFSWWGAWLADSGVLTYAPRRWFAEESKAADNPAPDRWMLL